MSSNQILLSKLEIEQTVNQEVFVSYGKALTCKDGIIEIAGLRNVMAGEVVKVGKGQAGLVLNLRKNSVSAAVQSDLITFTKSLLHVPVVANLLGWIVVCLDMSIGGFSYEKFLHSRVTAVYKFLGVLSKYLLSRKTFVCLKLQSKHVFI